jgi:protein-L-isoaspartate(D-aspartate) O-methyltransferase
MGIHSTDTDFAVKRHRMVEQQLRRRGITDARVLAAMGCIPRHDFIPAGDASAAYDDAPQPIGLGQTISQPYMVARMTELLHLDEGSRVLEIGTGSGYQAAVLGTLAHEVWTIERHADLARTAERTLIGLGYDNIHVVVGDGSLGLPEHALYDAIVATAAAPRVPPALRAQLAPGGRLVIPVGDRESQWLTIVTHEADGDREVTDLGCRFVPLVGEHGYDGAGARPADEPAADPGKDGVSSAGALTRQRVRVTVAGRVQGVWFRASTQEHAERLGVDGWVRNRADGDVEAVFEGPPEAVAAMIAWVHHGPERAIVTEVRTADEPIRGERGFSVR